MSEPTNLYGQGQKLLDIIRAEEMHWIAWCKEAEARAETAGSRVMELKAWGQDVVVFLRDVLEPPFGISGRGSFVETSRLLTDAIVLGIIPEPDCPRCGGRKI